MDSGHSNETKWPNQCMHAYEGSAGAPPPVMLTFDVESEPSQETPIEIEGRTCGSAQRAKEP